MGKNRKKRQQAKSADCYRALSMAYATGTVPEVIIRTVKVKEVPRHIRQREALERSAKPGKAEFARKLRKNMTEAEQHLWAGGLCRFREYFYPQGVVHGYIADFLCLQYKVVIEVDGEYHNSPEQGRYDRDRTDNLKRKGFKVLRFTNAEVMQNRTAVLGKIVEAL